ncbi:hypothetical protein GUJ93_ZPchr0002g26612 [Zizania palustris]|uniref:Uncharacterized protein n=1 Tax=Zizania palustris TaxID=103762 RepID=A0A8J5V9V1_ZIZPA|nr:hypothetical protein GUJ93_ZPchr0002g26612 [Zizania palustris]
MMSSKTRSSTRRPQRRGEAGARFLKWRIQLLERGIQEQLDFSSNGIYSMVQVTDLKNSLPMLGKHCVVTRQVIALLQDNYPEFIAKKVNLSNFFLGIPESCPNY